MDIAELKAGQAALQKEIQNRKLYENLDNFVSQILGLEQNKGELERAVATLKTEREALLNDKRAVVEKAVADLTAAQDESKRLKDEAKTAVSAAKAEAAKLLKKAGDDAKVRVKKIEDDAANKIADLKIERDALVAAVADCRVAADLAKEKLDKINAELDKARDKARKMLEG